MSDDMKIIEFCRYLGTLKHLKRTGWVRNKVPEPESVASHMYRMAMLSFLVDGKNFDKEKCIKMSLVHDMAEAIVGDITPSCGVSDTDKHTREKEAMNKLASLVPDSVGAEFVNLWTEYESQETAESKLVKDLDKFDMITQAFEYETSAKKPGSLQEFFDSSKDVFRTDTVKSWVAELNAARDSKC